MTFRESEEREALRAAVRRFAKGYGARYFLDKARSGAKSTELWTEAGRLGYLGVAIAEEYGGGGGGIGDLAAVSEELSAAGCPLILMSVSPAVCATILARFGTDTQKKQWLPKLADGTAKMSFALTEPDAGSNAHRLTTVARRADDGWALTGRKLYISGVDEADAILVVARMEDSRTDRLNPALFLVPPDAPGLDWQPLEMDVVSPERQFLLYLDDVRLPRDALVGEEGAGLDQLFAGLNPERILGASFGLGIARYALDLAADYARTRQVWSSPIGAHQGLAHPLAKLKIELEMARLMNQKAAWLYDNGEDTAAGEAANMAKYAAAEVAAAAVDQSIQVHGGSGMATETSLAAYLALSRVLRIAPVTREMILNYVAQHTLGLPKSY